MKTPLLTLLSSLLVVLGLSSCVPLDPYFDGGGYQSGGGGGYGGGSSYGGSSYGNSYGSGGYSPRPSYGSGYGNSSGYGQSYGHNHACSICGRSNCDGHHSTPSSNSHNHSSSSNSRGNDTLYYYRGKKGPSGNHTIDWWHDRGYQRSQLDFAN